MCFGIAEDARDGGHGFEYDFSYLSLYISLLVLILYLHAKGVCNMGVMETFFLAMDGFDINCDALNFSSTQEFEKYQET